MIEKKINSENLNIEHKLIVSSSPHILSDDSTRNIMWTVSIFLMPASLFGIYVFGLYSGIVLLFSIISAIISELISQFLRKKTITIDDGSAFLTGLLIGMNMPPSVPLYIPILSSIFAIVIVKQAFGGLGQNWANPAIAARVFALVAWSKHMTTWTPPFSADTITTATPLMALKSALLSKGGAFTEGPIELLKSLPFDFLKTDVNYFNLFFGYKAGCIGEISVFLLLIPAFYLIITKIITPEIPLFYIGTVALIAWIFDGIRFGLGFFKGDPLFHILTGGLILGAFFMATDMVTTPITIKGRIIFGIGCGIITMLIRMFGGLPEGVSLSIIFMNMLTPAIDRFIKIRPLGFHKKINDS